MPVFFEYLNQANRTRQTFLGLPSWARIVLLIAALPGIVLALLSILAFLVSLLALLLLTLPVYSLLSAVTGKPEATPGTVSPGTKRVEVTVVDRPV